MIRVRSTMLLSLAIAMAPSGSFAADKPCLEAHVDAQQLRGAGKLRAAKEKLLACSAKECHSLVKVDCTRWLGEVETAMPTVILAAKDGDGKDVVDVKVTVDGEAFVEKLDGKALELDPGTHKIRYEREGSAPIETEVMIKATEKDRLLSVTFASAPKAIKTERSLLLPLAFVGLGTIALGSFAYFGLTANHELDQMRAEGGCSPRCDPEERDAVKRKYLYGDISLGIAALSFGTAAILYFTTGPSESASGIAVRPVAGGAITTWSAKF